MIDCVHMRACMFTHISRSWLIGLSEKVRIDHTLIATLPGAYACTYCCSHSITCDITLPSHSRNTSDAADDVAAGPLLDDDDVVVVVAADDDDDDDDDDDCDAGWWLPNSTASTDDASDDSV